MFDFGFGVLTVVDRNDMKCKDSSLKALFNKKAMVLKVLRDVALCAVAYAVPAFIAASQMASDVSGTKIVALAAVASVMTGVVATLGRYKGGVAGFFADRMWEMCTDKPMMSEHTCRKTFAAIAGLVAGGFVYATGLTAGAAIMNGANVSIGGIRIGDSGQTINRTIAALPAAPELPAAPGTKIVLRL